MLMSFHGVKPRVTQESPSNSFAITLQLNEANVAEGARQEITLFFRDEREWWNFRKGLEKDESYIYSHKDENGDECIIHDHDVADDLAAALHFKNIKPVRKYA